MTAFAEISGERINDICMGHRRVNLESGVLFRSQLLGLVWPVSHSYTHPISQKVFQ
jgi:hypothetical protein